MRELTPGPWDSQESCRELSERLRPGLDVRQVLTVSIASILRVVRLQDGLISPLEMIPSHPASFVGLRRSSFTIVVKLRRLLLRGRKVSTTTWTPRAAGST